MWQDVFTNTHPLSNADTVPATWQPTPDERRRSDAFLERLQHGPMSADDIRALDTELNNACPLLLLL